MFNKTSAVMNMLNLLTFQSADIKYCTFYGKKNLSVKYICYKNEICCEQGNGCCSNRSFKYYESWCFWIVIFGIILAFYLLCWYCKKIEKSRQALRINNNVNNAENAPRNCRVMAPRLRTIDPNGVDHLLETLIVNYRNRLSSGGSTQTISNNDETKIDQSEPPPKYSDALNMPKPTAANAKRESNSIAANIGSTQISNGREINDGGRTNTYSFVVVEMNDLNNQDQDVPSYDEAIKKI